LEFIWDDRRRINATETDALRRSARTSKLVRKTNEYIRGKMDAQDIVNNPKTTNLVGSCRENGPNTFTKNYDLLGTGRKEHTRPSPKNLERGDIQSHEGKRPKNGRMRQQKAMEYGSQKASSDIVNPRNILYVICNDFEYFT
jgi:hypothetical protein